MNVITAERAPTAKDFASDQEVRWCPGCGDYAILKAAQKALADVGARPERTVFVSGIGCSSRFPYYMATYGFHTIHGRAPAVATGIKLANPDLDVWIATGDGDALSIGGNHLMHILRRDIDVQILLFNNEIYGLTKGQYSPTSRPGTVSPSSPRGSLDRPLSPAQLALGAGGRFVARAIDTQQKPLVEVMKQARAHRGASFVEIFQNCIVYNDGVYADFTEKSVAADRQILVEDGRPLLFGADRKKGLRVNPTTLALEVVAVGENGVALADVQVHNAGNRALATMLAALQPPTMPVALGVLYRDPSTREDGLGEAGTTLRNPATPKQLNELLRRGDTWTIS